MSRGVVVQVSECGYVIREIVEAPDPEISALRASHARLCDEYQALVADVIAVLGVIGWPRDAAARVAIEGVRARIGLGAIPEPAAYIGTNRPEGGK